MKHILIALYCLAFMACRTVHQQRQSDSNMSATARTDSRSRQQISYRDSTGRQWLFWSDTLFSFHTDSGLSAQRGLLWGRYSTVVAKHGSTSQDSTSYRTVQAQAKSAYRAKQKQTSWRVEIYITLLMLIGLASLLCFRKM